MCVQTLFLGSPANAQEELAELWKNSMPAVAVDLVRNKRLAPGADLVKLVDEHSRPCSQDFMSEFFHFLDAQNYT